MERVTELEPETIQVKVQVVGENPNKIPPFITPPTGLISLKQFKMKYKKVTLHEKALKAQQTIEVWESEKDKAKKRLALRQDEEPESTKSHVTRNIPPYDASATTPQKAYLLNQIIHKGEWNHLDDIYIILLQGVAANFSSYPRFIRNRIEKLKKIEGESEKKKLSCIFSYINHLIKFKDQHSQHSMNDASSSNHIIPDILLYQFTKMFDVYYNKKLLSKEKIDLLIYYVLVLTLFADEFQTDYRDIAKDLRMSYSDVKLNYVHLGCKISRPENKDNGKWYFYVTLPVPLQFPV